MTSPQRHKKHKEMTKKTTQLLHLNLATNQDQSIYVWEQRNLLPFDELIVSWEANRPLKGFFLISVSLFTTDWYPWLDYAFWGHSDQYTFHQQLSNVPYRTFQDTIEILGETKATGFKIRIIAKEGASLKEFRTLHACITDMKGHYVIKDSGKYDSIHLDLDGLSQIVLEDPRHMRICSPTSTTAVIRYLSKVSGFSPLPFADRVWDSTFDIYGNWILNIAEAAHVLGSTWHCCVARLDGFNQIVESLMNGYPVVVSVQGPLPGSAQEYKSGHLIVVKGYEACEQKVLCMDPAFPGNHFTHVGYALDDFLKAWNRRHRISYLFYFNR